MPTSITAQSGAVLKQTTLVEPEGCPNKLTILSHKVKNRSITLKVAVPGAGKLSAGGKGLETRTMRSTGRGVLTLTLRAKGRGKLRSEIKLSFAPSRGKKLAASATIRVS